MTTTLYPGIPFSPQATITNNIGAADSIIEVSDVSAFPPAPNLATIGTDEEGETILYTAKTETALSGCQRGIEGTAKAWMAGELIGRNFTAKDHADLISVATTAGTVAAAKQPKLTGQPGQVVGFAADGTAVAVPGWSNPNLLLNWDFRNPVNRNGTAEYTTSTVSIYTLDRWVLSGSSSANAKLEVVDGGVRITSANAFRQTAEDSVTKSLVGKIVTVSALIDVEVPPQSGQIGIVANNAWIGSTPLPKTAGTDILVSATISVGNVPKLAPWIYSDDGGIYKLKAMKLELGTQQTLARQNEDGEWEIIDPPDYDLQYALCSLYSPSTGEWVGYQHSNPNLLDNWYFADPVNQRGQAEYTAAGYTIDRFRMFANAGTSITCKVEDDGVALSAVPPAGGSGQANFTQILAPNVLLPGVYTLSWLYSSDCLVRPFVTNGQVLPGYMDFPASDTPAVASIQLKITEEMQEQNTLLHIQINSSVEAHVKLYAAKLELGSQQTLAHQDADGNWVLNDPPPNKALELAKCQRYQLVLPGTSAKYPLLGIGNCAVSDHCAIMLPTPVSMRVKPTAVYTDLNGFVLGQDKVGDQSLNVTNISVGDSLSENSVYLNVYADGLTIGKTYIFTGNRRRTSQLVLDANL